ncbi:MAG: hypothetical protein ABJL44_01015 [Algibacter sp.]
MKHIKFLFLIIALGGFLNSCVVEDGENPFYSPDEYGVYPIYTDVVNGFFDIIDVNSASVGFTVAPSESGGAKSNGSGEIQVNFNGGDYVKIADVASFPSTNTFTLNDVAAVLTEVNTASLTLDDLFSFRVYFNLDDGQKLTSGSLINVPMNCASDFGGTFDYVSTSLAATSGFADCTTTTTTGTVTFTDQGGGSYLVSDLGFGQYGICWGDTPATSPDAVVTDSCLKLITGGLDQYGLVYTWTITDISGSILSLSWANDYGDSGVAVLTRQDGNDWPELFTE